MLATSFASRFFRIFLFFLGLLLLPQVGTLGSFLLLLLRALILLFLFIEFVGVFLGMNISIFIFFLLFFLLVVLYIGGLVGYVVSVLEVFVKIDGGVFAGDLTLI